MAATVKIKKPRETSDYFVVDYEAGTSCSGETKEWVETYIADVLDDKIATGMDDNEAKQFVYKNFIVGKGKFLTIMIIPKETEIKIQEGDRES